MRHILGYPALVAAALLAAVPAQAAPSSSKLCNDPNFATPQINACMEKAADDADHKLNVAYKKALAVIDGDGDRTADQKAHWRAQLTAAQRAWIAFRDADCGDLVVTEWNGGTGMGSALSACRYDLTVQRTDEILSRYPLH